jgi:hypothetical protein
VSQSRGRRVDVLLYVQSFCLDCGRRGPVRAGYSNRDVLDNVAIDVDQHAQQHRSDPTDHFSAAIHWWKARCPICKAGSPQFAMSQNALDWKAAHVDGASHQKLLVEAE